MTEFARPNLFIPGTPKGATTSLANWLSQHSEIHVSDVKEPWFFNDDRSTGHFVGREQKYRELFPVQEGVKYYCDATPDYLYSPSAMEQISNFSPSARFLVTFRSYAEAYFSLHQQERFMNLEPIESAEEALQACNERRREAKRSRRPELKSLFYDERLRVGAQLYRALECIPRERFLLIDFSLIRDKPHDVWRAIEDFLGVGSETVSFNVQNTRKFVATGNAARILRQAKKLKNVLGIRGKSRLADALRERMSPPDQAPPSISDEFRAAVNSRFRPDRQLVQQFAIAGPAIMADDFYSDADQEMMAGS